MNGASVLEQKLDPNVQIKFNRLVKSEVKNYKIIIFIHI